MSDAVWLMDYEDIQKIDLTRIRATLREQQAVASKQDAANSECAVALQ